MQKSWVGTLCMVGTLGDAGICFLLSCVELYSVQFFLALIIQAVVCGLNLCLICFK
jgi:hypothetical protein